MCAMCCHGTDRRTGEYKVSAEINAAAADLIACPSRIEPLGNVVLEAWARQRPIVAAAADGPMELIRDRENGLLVPIDDPEAMARAISVEPIPVPKAPMAP